MIPHTLTLIPTYRCSAECADCCFHSNPRIKHRIPQARLLGYIHEAADSFPALGVVVITGGEAFVLGADLVEIVRVVRERGLISRVVTNGFWATSRVAARRILQPLVEAGLGELSFSTGDDHVEFVPLSRVVAGMAEAVRFGIGVSLMIEQREGRVVRKDTVMEAAREFPDLLREFDEGRALIIESPWMRFAESEDPIRWGNGLLANSANVHARRACDSIMASAVVTPSEKLGMCCGLSREDIPDLNVGDLRTDSMLELYQKHSHDLMKIWLAVEGPERMLAWAASKDPSIDWENKYAHNCDACRALYGDPRVMSAIEKFASERIDDLLARYAPLVAADQSNKRAPVKSKSAAAQIVPLALPGGRIWEGSRAAHSPEH